METQDQYLTVFIVLLVALKVIKKILETKITPKLKI